MSKKQHKRNKQNNHINQTDCQLALTPRDLSIMSELAPEQASLYAEQAEGGVLTENEEDRLMCGDDYELLYGDGG